MRKTWADAATQKGAFHSLENAKRCADENKGYSVFDEDVYKRQEWKYTEKGWFCYELCVPEPPEVSEIVDGSCLIRIKDVYKRQALHSGRQG